MSRIFDAIQRGGDNLTQTIMSALADPAPSKVDGEVDADALIGKALDNLPDSDPPRGLPSGMSSKAPLLPRAASQVNSIPVATVNSGIRQVALKITGKSPLLPFDTANWRASEQYRTVRTRILQHPQQPRMIAVSSAGAGDGKTVTAINIAGAISLKAEADVVLIDADFRRSSVHKQLSLPLSPGLTDILLGQCTLDQALVRAEQFPNFYILPAGNHVENPSDLLETSRWASLRQQFTDRFQIVVFDCPPVRAVSEWDLLQAACDGIIFVGRQDYTKLEEFGSAIRSLPADKVIGVVMNCVNDWFLARPHSSYDYPQAPKARAAGQKT